MSAKKLSLRATDYLDNSECDCLGRQNMKPQCFLLRGKNASLNMIGLSGVKQEQTSTGGLSRSSSEKRSLRKARQSKVVSPEARRQTNVHHEYYSPEGTNAVNEKRDKNMLGYRQSQMKGIHPRIYFNFDTNKESIALDKKQVVPKVNSCRNLPLFNHSIKQVVYPPVYLNPYSSEYQLPSSSLKINFQQPVSPPVLLSTPTNDFKRNQIPELNAKEVLKSEPQTAEDIKSQCFLSIPENMSLRINIKSGRSFKSIPEEDSVMRKESGEPSQIAPELLIEPPKLKEKQKVFRSKIDDSKQKAAKEGALKFKGDTKRSKVGEGTVKSKIAMKKNKEDKSALKRITDVEQIHSLVDSNQQQDDDSDKESVVLGRLREYGSSSVQPASSMMPSLQSKMGYQSTTAEKSLVRAFDSIYYH